MIGDLAPRSIKSYGRRIGTGLIGARGLDLLLPPAHSPAELTLDHFHDAPSCSMIPHQMLSLSDAKTIAAAAHAEAVRNDWTVVIAIVDDGGHLLYLERMDGTQKASCLVAQEKARTAILFKRPTVALEKVVADGRVAMMTLPGFTMVEGGLPIVHQGAFVGAIGVSGVQSSQDGLIARAGIDALMV